MKYKDKKKMMKILSAVFIGSGLFLMLIATKDYRRIVGVVYILVGWWLFLDNVLGEE